MMLRIVLQITVIELYEVVNKEVLFLRLRGFQVDEHVRLSSEELLCNGMLLFDKQVLSSLL